MAEETLIFEVDWDNDGLFAHAESDITSDLLEVSYGLGRDYGSTLHGRSTAGSLSASLRNDDNKYSPNNSSSPIFGKVRPNRRVRLKSRFKNGQNAAQFVSASSNHLFTADNPALSVADIDFTLVAWFYVDSLPGAFSAIAGKFLQPNDVEYLFFLDSGGILRWIVSSDGTDPGRTDLAASGTIATGRWYFVVGWHDSLANTLNVQVNDGTADSTAHAGGATDQSAVFAVGCQDGGGLLFDGRIARVGFWKRTLTAAEKTWLYHNGMGRTYRDLGVAGTGGANLKTSLSGWWNLDEPSGTRSDSHQTSHLTENTPMGVSEGPYYEPVVQWHGYLDEIIPDSRMGGAHEARLEAYGPLARVNAQKAYVASATSVLTGAAITSVLDSVDFPAGDRTLDTGLTTMNRHWVEGKQGVAALKDVEESEAGFIRETKDAGIAFEDRHHRLKGAHLTSQITYSDAAGVDVYYESFAQSNPLEQIANVVRAKVRAYTVQALATLWTLSESGANSPAIGPGETVSFVAEYPAPDSQTEDIGVDAWTTPVATTDYTANSQAGGGGTDLTSDLSIAVVKSFETMEISVTNNGSGSAFLTLLQARGTAIKEDQAFSVQHTDSASKTEFGTRRYNIPAEFIPNSNEARAYCQFIAGRHANPVDVLTVGYAANGSQDLMNDSHIRDISDRVTVVADNLTGLGINGDYFVERKEDSIDRSGVHRVTLELSEADVAFGSVIVLDTGPGLDTGQLGY